MPLSPEQKRQLCTFANIGCDREIAALLAGCTSGDLQYELAVNETFAAEFARSEATAEFLHVRNVQEAARDVKNWRSSTWWLERRAPDRYGRRAPRSIRLAELTQFFAELSQQMNEVITDEQSRDELLHCLSVGFDRLKESIELEDDADAK